MVIIEIAEYFSNEQQRNYFHQYSVSAIGSRVSLTVSSSIFLRTKICCLGQTAIEPIASQRSPTLNPKASLQEIPRQEILRDDIKEKKAKKDTKDKKITREHTELEAKSEAEIELERQIEQQALLAEEEIAREAEKAVQLQKRMGSAD